MKITNTAIKYRTTVLVLTVVLVLGGIYSYITIPKEANPSIEIPNIVVTTIYPGASPDDVESLLTQPIESEIQVINGIKAIRSTSTEGVSSIVVEFEPDISIDEAFAKVRDKVDVAKAELPSDVDEPIVNEIDMSEFPILSINLSAPYPLTRLKVVAEELQDGLEAIPSVLAVDLIGGLDREVSINVDLARLQGYNLTFRDIVNAISDENTNVPGGSVDVDELNYLVRIDGEIQSPEELRDIVIKSPDGRPIYIRDIADVEFGFKERSSYSRLAIYQEEDANGDLFEYTGEDRAMLPVISLNVKKRSGENILETVDEVGAVLDGYVFPTGTQVIITGDQSVFVEDLITDLENNIISGLIFVIAVLLFFLGARNATLVGLAIPMSMLLSFIIFQALGYTLNFVILFSLIIALGMLVDNAIVIVENIYRFREEGYSRFEAAKLGTAEVAGAVIASTATTVAVFFPMLFWPGTIGEFMSWMPLTLIIALVSSLFVAIIINPVITGIFVKLDDEETEERPVFARRVFTGIILVLGLALGLANWKTLLVLVIAVPGVMILHRFLFKPIGDNFIKTSLPLFIDRYRAVLNWMLERDYSGKRALLRNTFSLGSFTLGFFLLLVSLLVSSTLGDTSSMLFMAPGGLLLALGALGVLIHTFEGAIIGKNYSIKAGILLTVLAALFLTLMWMLEKDVDISTAANLLIFPLLIAGAGLVGKLFVSRSHLILTDNRSILLNGSVGSLILIIFMFALAPTGVEFFPNTSPRQVKVTTEGPLGMNLDASNEIAEEARKRLEALLSGNDMTRENIKNMSVNVGVSSDAQFGGSSASPERSRITFNLVDYPARSEDSFLTMERIRTQLSGIPGAVITIDKDQDGPPTGPPVNIEITGPDFGTITQITDDIRSQLRSASETQSIPGLVDVEDNLSSGRPEVQVRIDRERAARFDISTRKIASTVRAAINGIEAGKYRENEDEYDILVRLREGDRSSLESLRDLTILEEGTQIPLVSVADLEVESGLGSVTRLDLQRVALVTANAAPGFNSAAILGEVQATLADYEANMPARYTLSYTGESEEQAESFGFLTIVMIVGVSLIFMILIAQFNLISSPFIIMVAVGFSLIGVMLGLILTRTPFGLMTFIGLISLAGIVVNNNIVLIDYTMQLRNRGVKKHDAIIEAGATRLRPVLLTALTTVLGLIPLTFGINIDFVGLLTDLDPNFQFGSENTQFWGPMGTAIISGLTFATFLTLVIVPVMYSAFDSLAIRLQVAFKGEAYLSEATIAAQSTDNP
ncbi:MAG: efflux RND transporter permease subunit [Bacteroidetes Order II. Incertae sedis bacterium]|nr:efflux RND transporter permease subunit [Bacteroidetes Order II. bacterium]MBT7401039.1 efflux RND transporter permease subunit [Bacteroidetes Order II. bacterium]